MLSEKNSHPLDSRIKFKEEGHIYWIDDDLEDIISATTFIKTFEKEFDSDASIENILNNPKYNNDPKYEYYQMKPQLIKRMWDDNGQNASKSGTDLHKDIENFYNSEPYNDSVEFNYFLNFYRDHKDLEIYRTEFLVFSDVLKLTGSIDALFKNKDGTFSIGDWKRTKKDLGAGYGKKMKFPFEHLDNSKLITYSLQLNLYRIILEKFYGFTIKDLFLVVLHPKYSNYVKITVDRMEDEAEFLLMMRMKQMIELGYDEELYEDLNFKQKIENLNEIVKEKLSQPKRIMNTKKNNFDPNDLGDDDDYENYRPLLSRNKPVIATVKSDIGFKDEDILLEHPKVIELENNIKVVEENPLANKGKKWIDDDDKSLMEKAKNGENLDNLSKVYKRSCGAVKLRIIHNILKEVINDEDIIEYCKSVPQVKEEDVKDYRNKQEFKKIAQKDKQEKKKMSDLDKLKYKAPIVNTPPSRGLSEKQQEAYDLMIKGKNVMITSGGGYGKSFLIKKIAYEFRTLKVGITSTTGVSAILIGGSTIHSYLGIGLGSASVEKLYMLIKNKPYINKRWKELDVLIIDEISMLDPVLLDKLELLARKIRRNEEPFGGIQVILSGDFYQLPVVGSELFCFDAECFSRLIPRDHIVELDVNFRQGNNQFQRILNEIRIGEVSDESMEILRTREDAILENEYGIIPTKIFALNRDVDEYNENALNDLCLKNPELEFFEFQLTYDIMKSSMKSFDFEEKLRKNCNVPFTLQLCVGAQVMLLYNVDLESGLCNGSRGVVVGFDGDLPLVKFLNGKTVLINYQTWTIEEDNGDPILMYSQIPLRISYAITNHKSQGCSLDYADVDLKSVFADGQSYVGLSRVRTLEGLCIRNLNRECFRANPRVKEFYNSLQPFIL